MEVWLIRHNGSVFDEVYATAEVAKHEAGLNFSPDKSLKWTRDGEHAAAAQTANNDFIHVIRRPVKS